MLRPHQAHFTPQGTRCFEESQGASFWLSRAFEMGIPQS